MEEKTVNPILRQALELGPPLGFFVAYLWMRDMSFHLWGRDYDGFIVAAALFVPVAEKNSFRSNSSNSPELATATNSSGI